MKSVGAFVALADLDPNYLRRLGAGSYECVDTLEQADGIGFLCPKCFLSNKGDDGTHRVTCWFEGRVEADANPGPGRWTAVGTGWSDLTFVPGETIKATSVLLTGGCRWHGHIVGGRATILPG